MRLSLSCAQNSGVMAAISGDSLSADGFLWARQLSAGKLPDYMDRPTRCKARSVRTMVNCAPDRPCIS